jgi:HK97 gp10 family phage protein
MAKTTQPVTFTLKVTGLPEMLKKLKVLQVDVEKAVAASLLASAFIVSNDAKRRAPRLTGNLARSITPGVGTDPLGSSGPIKDTEGSLPAQSVETLQPELKAEGKATAWVATNVVYAKRMEYGFKGPDKLGRKYSQAGRPYMRPAMDENKNKLNAEFTKALKQVIASAEGKGTKSGT